MSVISGILPLNKTNNLRATSQISRFLLRLPLGAVELEPARSHGSALEVAFSEKATSRVEPNGLGAVRFP